MIAFLRRVTRQKAPSSPAPVDQTLDEKRAIKQLAAFADALNELGLQIEWLEPVTASYAPALLADAAIPLPDAIVLACPNEPSRRIEVESAADGLSRHRPVVRIVEPALIEGRDVLRIGRTLFIGLTSATNSEAVAMLAETVEPFGFTVRSVALKCDERLKTVCSFIPPRFLVANPDCVDPLAFGGVVPIGVDPSEPAAANTLTVAGSTFVSAAFPRTRKRLRDQGIVTRPVELDEFQKIGAGPSCLPLILEPKSTAAGVQPSLKIVRSVEPRSRPDLFSPAVVHGGVAYISSQLPFDPRTGKMIEGDVAEQTTQALANLASVLAASGSTPSHLLRLTCFVADPKLQDRVAAACSRFLGGHRPAGTIVAAKTLRPGCLVAIDAIAAIADELRQP